MTVRFFYIYIYIYEQSGPDSRVENNEELYYSLSYFPVDFRDTDSQFWRWNSSRGLLYSLWVHTWG